VKSSLLEAYAAKIGGTPADAEAEIVRIAYEVAGRLSRRFTFGYHSREDIEAQGVLEALEVLEGDAYDVSRPLEGFLYTHVRRRLLNMVRRQLVRSERPCRCCDPADPPADPCPKFRGWRRRNASKRGIMQPLDVSCVADDGEARMSTPSTVEEEAASSELLRRIDEGLAPELRADYLRMRAGCQVPKGRRQRVREAILEVLD
jgi:DNA-directed RNA polymerase specialized sigma24 family protein